MKYENKDLLKEKCVELYLQGKTMAEIAKVVNCSRNYVGTLIKDAPEIKQYKNTKTVKVYKLKTRNQMNVPISVDFLEKIGISKDVNNNEYVDVSVDENKKKIIIVKHKI